jgi:hypothetical protein
MCLTESMTRFLEANELLKKDLDPESREFVVVSCRIMYLRNLLQALIDPMNAIEVRKEFLKLFREKDYVGEGHEHLIKEYDKGNKLIF